MRKGISKRFFHNFSAVHAEKIVEKIPFSCYFAPVPSKHRLEGGCLAGKIMLFAWFCGLAVFAGAAELYYTNRTFTVVVFSNQLNRSADMLNAESKKLTNIVKGAAVKLDMTNTCAIEKQAAIPICYGSAEGAWDAAVAYNGSESNYPGKTFDNVGWVRGTKSVNGDWGAYLWVIQNRIAFQSSTLAWWTTNGISVAITNVMVGSLGDYGPVSNVVDVGPIIPTNFPGANYSDSGMYQVDITNVYYALSIPDIWITPRSAVACIGGSNVQYTVTGTNIPQGVTWKIIPEGVGATIQTNGDWYHAEVTPGNVGTNYKIRATSVDNTNFYDEVNLAVLELELTNMTFGAGWSLTRDTGGAYPSPHWTATNSSPYLYERSTKVNVSAVFKVLPTSFSGNITINGDGPDNLDFTNVTVSASGGLATYPATDSTGLLTNTMDFWNPMQINWKYGINESPSHDAGTSSNMIYVCLSDPSSVPTLYHTVVHLACSVGHATNEAQAVSNSWSQLTGHNFKTWDGQTLYYYKPGIGWNLPTTVSGMLSSDNGNCHAWMELFRDALRVNGIQSTRVYVTSPNNGWFLVKDWTFGAATLTTAPYNWMLKFASNETDMVPIPSGSIYGDLTSLTTIPGQNSSPPSEKSFGCHYIRKYQSGTNLVYYDPSYGVTYSGTNDFQTKAVDGYADDNGLYTNGCRYISVKQVTNTCEISFTDQSD